MLHRLPAFAQAIVYGGRRPRFVLPACLLALLGALALTACDITTTSPGGSATATPAASPAPTFHLVVHTGEAMVSATSKEPARASCNPNLGEQMIGGGFKVSPTSLQIHVMESYPANATTWQVFARNISSSAGAVDAYVYCYVGPPTLTIRIVPSAATTVVAGAAGGTATASCGSDIATSGGFYFSPVGSAAPNNLDPDGWLVASQPGSGAATWAIAAQARSESPPLVSPGVALVAYAICVGADHIATGSFPSAVVSVPGGGERGGMVAASACGAGQTLVNGGFKPDPGASWNFVIDGGETLDHWFVDAFNGNPGALNVTILGECVKFF